LTILSEAGGGGKKGVTLSKGRKTKVNALFSPLGKKRKKKKKKEKG